MVAPNHRDLKSDLPHLRKKAYYVRDVQEALVSNAKPDFISRLSSDDYNWALAMIQHPGQLQSKSELLSVVKRWMRIFDKAFYFGQGRKRISKVSVYVSSDGKIDEEAAGYYNSDEKAIYIRLDDPKATGLRYMSTAVHEMLHAFLNYHSCTCSAHCKKRVKPRNKQRRNGNGGNAITGHGPMFMNPMTAIFRAIGEAFGVEAEPTLVDSLMEEMWVEKWQPRPDQFEKWGFPYVSLDEALQVGAQYGAITDDDDGDEIVGDEGGVRVLCNVM